MKFLWLALAFLAPLPASADAPAGGAQSLDSYRPQVEEVQRVAADPAASVYTIWDKNQRLPFDNVRVSVDVSGFRGWDMGGKALGDGNRVEVADMVQYGRAQLTDLGIDVPQPLRDSLNEVSTLASGGRVREGTAEEMGEGQMGRFKYNEGDRQSGQIDVHELMPFICGVIGKAFCFSTLVHEGRHRVGHLQAGLTEENEVRQEMDAYRAQFDWLVKKDPYGERVPYARAWVANLIRRWGHNRVVDGAERYLTHLAELRATGGEERPLRELVERYGYRNHHHRQEAAAPADASRPTRS